MNLNQDDWKCEGTTYFTFLLLHWSDIRVGVRSTLTRNWHVITYKIRWLKYVRWIFDLLQLVWCVYAVSDLLTYQECWWNVFLTFLDHDKWQSCPFAWKSWCIVLHTDPISDACYMESLSSLKTYLSKIKRATWSKTSLNFKCHLVCFKGLFWDSSIQDHFFKS